MRLYGLTGGIGSGKSEAARRYAERGIPTIDADKLAHRLIEPGGEAVDDVVEAFGPGILAEGRIDREKLGAVVFVDAEARQKLNRIVHPWVARKVAQECAAFAQKGYEAVLVDAALLAEGGERESWLDGLVLVLCSAAIRLERLTATRGMTAAQAQQRIDAQTPPEDKAPVADWIITNEGTLDALYARVDAVAGDILARARESETPH